MKTKSLLFLLLLIGLNSLHAQTFYKIYFSGEPDSILVENLTKGTGLTLQGTDTLSLKLSSVGVQETDRSKRTLIFYPNPMDHSCRFDLENTTQGRVEIQLFNANGKKVHDFNARLSAGMHQFELSGVPAGVYHLQIKTESYRLSGSFVSTYESSPDVRLIHKKESPFRLTNGNADGNQKLAQDDVPLSLRSIVVMDFSTGDQLKFTGYKTNSDDDVEFASPTGDQTIGFTFCVRPFQPSAISGNDNPCAGTTQNYAVTHSDGVTYTWSVPAEWMIVSGQGTSSITVTAGATAGNITVTPSNTCGTGTAQTFTVTTQTVPAQPSAISGMPDPCQGTTDLIYSVTHVPVVNYTWSVPTGWIITAGEGTNSITVTAGTADGNISVTPSNTCGNGPVRTLAVTAQLIPAQPSTITGNNNPCQGATGLNYSVNNVAGVTYTWSVPSGWNITSGQGTNSITVTAVTSSGNIIVTPSNTCGTGSARTLAVTTQTVPAQPSTITGNNNPCQGATGLNYTVTNVAGVTYTWSVPSGWNITSGQNTNSINVTAGSASGNISVTPSNTCGNGTSQSMAVTTQTVPATPTAGTHVPSQTQIVWNWNSVSGATGYKYNTTNNYATATDNGTSTTYTQTGLTCNTAYTLYVWAYNGCGNSTAVQLSQTTSACTSGCGDPVTFTYNGSTVTYGSVTSANNKCWLDRNLGATQVATSSADAASYGHLFQWGRLDDGHQVRTSPTTTTLSNSDVPGHNMFITGMGYPSDWRSPQNNNLWQGEGGINNPCPDGYRLPTNTEWDAERASWSTSNAAGAFASPLKLPMAGLRNRNDGSVVDEGSDGRYWSSTVDGTNSWYLYFNGSGATMYYSARALGMSVRCLKD